MDPNETLMRLRQWATEAIRNTDAREELTEQDAIALEAAGLFQSLDGWLLQGGFLPRDWRKPK